ncbi:MAG: formylglycine-generating enzyme family protein, partial [Verrucomicrobiaceae bacterium]
MNIRLPRPAWVLALLTAAAPLSTAVLADTQPFDLGGGVRLELERIAKGQFTMGSPESETGRNPDEKAHPVTLSRDFYLGRTPVTVAQWQWFAMETGHRSEAENGVSGGYGWNGAALEQRAGFTWKNPGFIQSPDHPVVMVTWEDARQFMKWLGGKTGWAFDFPSEAQWEYACRAGTATAWWAGEDATAAGPALWSAESSGNQTHPATALPANPWRLHISGHVFEWCADWYGPYDGLPETDPLQGTPPPSDKPRRVLRGGSWLRPLKDTRSAARYRNDPRSRNADNGFRVMSYGPAAASGGGGPPPIEPPENGTTLTAGTVETVDPGDLQPDPAAENPHSGQSKTSSSGSAFWVRVLPWGIGALAVLWLLRRMTQG